MGDGIRTEDGIGIAIQGHSRCRAKCQITKKCTRVAKSGVLTMDNLSSRPGDFGRYAPQLMAIKPPEIKRLWGKAAGICSHPDCNTDCLQFLDADDPTIVGEMAHIIAKKPDGPRGKASGGEDTYANLILLCPTHHTLIDKAPEGTFPEVMLQEWKTNHEAEISNRLASPAFRTREEIDEYIQFLLIENKTCWYTFGPESKEAQRNPNSNSALFWPFRKLGTLIPNNCRIRSAIQAHKNLFAAAEYRTCCKFFEHATGFERNAIMPTEGVPRFPADFGELFDE